MVLAEKGIELPKHRLNIVDRENRQPAYLAMNPLGQVPALELDDGRILTEITAISEYIDELHPNPPLIGTNAFERAETRMWVRRLDLNILEPMLGGYRYGEGQDFFKDRMVLIPEASAGLKSIARQWLTWLNTQMAGRPYVVGDRFTLADIMLFCFTRFAGKVGQPFDPAWTVLQDWFLRIGQRPTAKA
jgi:glutathione S-transferase